MKKTLIFSLILLFSGLQISAVLTPDEINQLISNLRTNFENDLIINNNPNATDDVVNAQIDQYQQDADDLKAQIRFENGPQGSQKPFCAINKLKQLFNKKRRNQKNQNRQTGLDNVTTNLFS